MSRHKTKQRMMAMVLSVIMVVGMMPVSALAETGTFPISTSGEISAFEALGLDIAFQYVPFGTGKGDLELPDTLTATLRIAALDKEPVLDSGETDAKLDSADTVSGSAIGMDEIGDTEAGAEVQIASPSDAQEDGDYFEAEPMEKTVDSIDEITIPLPVTWTSSPEYNSDEPGVYVFTPVFSEGITIRDDVEVPTINVMLHSPEFAAIDEDAGKGLPKSAGTWVLQQLAAGAVSYVGGKAMEAAMAEFFGQPPSEIAGLLSELHSIKDMLERTNVQIEQLISKVNQAELKNDLRTHWVLMNKYATVYSALCGSIEDRKDSADLTNIFLTRLFDGSNKNYMVGDMTIINATITLGNSLTRTCVGGNYNIFGAYDRLEKYTNRWEHQGYAARQAFREEALLVYSMFSMMSQLACEAAITNNPGDSVEAQDIRLDAARWLKDLKANALKVYEMDGRCAVIEHPHLRIYRDTKRGEDLYTFRTEIQKGYMYQPTDPEWSTFTRNANMLASKEFLRPMSKAVRYNLEYYSWGYMVYSQQPSNAIYKRIYDDYKAANGGVYGISLMQIFFNDDKGDFTHPPGEVLDRTGFANNAYTWERMHSFLEPWPIGKWTMTVTTEGASSRTVQLMEAGFVNGTSPLLRIGKPSTEIFYSPILYYGKVDQGMLMLPEDDTTPELVQGIVMFDLNGGTRTGGGELIQVVDEGTAAAAPMVHRSNYTFVGWDKSFDTVTSDMTVTAIWRYDGGGGSGDSGGGYTPAPIIPTDKQPDMPSVAKPSVSGTVKDGILSATITEQMVKDALKAAQDAAKKSGKELDGIALDFNVSGSGNYSNLNATIDAGAIDRLKEVGVKFIKIGSSVLDVTLDMGAIAEIDKQSTGTVTISAKRLTKLSDAAKKLIANRPVFDITVSYQKNGKTEYVSNFGKGAVTLGIAYKATGKENKGNLFGVYVDKNGKPQLLTNSSYDNTGRLIFSRNSLSTYGVGYKAPSPSFTDTAKHWAKDNIDFVASRDLISGTSATTFAPNTAITRADFLMALGRLSGADVSIYKTSSFTDVKSTDIAMPYIEWAIKSKVVSGYGNGKFGPNDSITREQMAEMMVNYAKATGYKLPVSKQAITFADNARISAYAKDAVKAIQQTGVINGKDNNRFDPQGNATRAEAATILRRFVELVIDEGTARGWVQNDAGKWQYISENGKPVIGWLTVESGKYHYYFTADGIMVYGKWLEIDGKWYYFYADGSLAKATKVDGYEVDENGVRKIK